MHCGASGGKKSVRWSGGSSLGAVSEALALDGDERQPGRPSYVGPNSFPRRASVEDEEALGMMMDRYGGALLHYAHRLVGDMQVAEEICQDTLLKAWQQAHAFQVDAHLKAWLFRVAHNQAIDCIRRRRPVTEEHHTACAGDCAQQPELAAERTWMLDAIVQAMEALPPQYRTVIEMRFFRDMGYREIALALQIPLGTVKSRLNYGLKGLARVLKMRGIVTESLGD